MSEQTPYLGLIKPDFNGIVTWHDEVNGNFDLIDAAVRALPGFVAIKGLWKNGTVYGAGDRVVDPANNVVWTANVAHTSSVVGTFLAERTAFPSRWSNISATFKNRGEWTAGVPYIMNEFISSGNVFGIVNVDYVSGSTFEEDVAAGKVTVLLDFTNFNPSAYASAIGNNTFVGENTFTGNFELTGQATFTGDVTFDGEITFDGNGTVIGDLTVDGNLNLTTAMQYLGGETATIINFSYLNVAPGAVDGAISSGLSALIPVDIVKDYTPRSPTSKLLVFMLFHLYVQGTGASTTKSITIYSSHRHESSAGNYDMTLGNDNLMPVNTLNYYGTYVNTMPYFQILEVTQDHLNNVGKWSIRPIARYDANTGTTSTAYISRLRALIIEYDTGA